MVWCGVVEVWCGVVEVWCGVVEVWCGGAGGDGGVVE